ncbi:hypothetical protein CVT24_004263 [Panaeolus cyanescens]|uniref:J domain-containing protein n=1 Tax=Panaeolus cyanescens TaxID=181874 RepID=A0A409VA81_9AGAR|nr:hypothetical protein CVT24_004263 [Panaeolus cyanescens]
MGTSSFFFSLAGWTFVPDFATRHLLTFVYKSALITPPAQAGNAQHRRHYAVAFAFVICSYLVYTLAQSSWNMKPSFYEILGVPPTVDENGLKLAFRSFAKRYHPDRVGPQGEELFMYVRDAYEALKDPVVRFAYDRFGPDVIGWRKTCKTQREFMNQGLMVSSGYHIVTGIALLFWSAIGRPSSVSFWRYVLFGALFAAELSFILSPFPTESSSLLAQSSILSSLFNVSPTAVSTWQPFKFSILETLFPYRVPYQHILFLHQVFMILSIALSRVVPQFLALISESGDQGRELDPVEHAIWERIFGTLAIADREASIILHTLLHSVTPSTTNKPYHEPTLARMTPLPPKEASETYQKLAPEMYNLVIEANIKNQIAGPVASAWEEAIRADAIQQKTKQAHTSSTPSKSNNGHSHNSGDSCCSPSTGTSPNTTSLTGSTATLKQPATPRAKNFWEKDVADAEEQILNAGSEDVIGSAGGAGTPGRRSPLKDANRTHSRPGSPTKPHSPVRKASFTRDF